MTCITIDPAGVTAENIKTIVFENRDNFISRYGIHPAYLYAGHGIAAMLIKMMIEIECAIPEFANEVKNLGSFLGMKVMVVENEYFHFRMTI